MKNDDEKRMEIIRRIVRDQTFDEGLWVKPHTIYEHILLSALQCLHNAVKYVQVDDIKDWEKITE